MKKGTYYSLYIIRQKRSNFTFRNLNYPGYKYQVSQIAKKQRLKWHAVYTALSENVKMFSLIFFSWYMYLFCDLLKLYCS